MHQIAEKLPKETTGMYACCNPVPPLLRKYVSDFHQVVLDARNGKHIEQEIDADVVILESVTPASSSPNVVPSHTTASRSAPHDTLSLATKQTPNANSCQQRPVWCHVEGRLPFEELPSVRIAPQWLWP
ncbi:exosome component 10 [Echinococcus multilocularis]|uniref:Exosome component 10 n=1 Tax=Echinococcus multilocularis TaxID=6211 RepID=A0A087VWD1_ECHMU|nr:exosome component 10 [Echinococcus multilocularis]